MTQLDNLFDTRGTSRRCCEYCTEPLDTEAVDPVCADCHKEEEKEDS